eukprot:2924917-Pyramimonas_sp.AAC.1
MRCAKKRVPSLERTALRTALHPCESCTFGVKVVRRSRAKCLDRPAGTSRGAIGRSFLEGKGVPEVRVFSSGRGPDREDGLEISQAPGGQWVGNGVPSPPMPLF